MLKVFGFIAALIVSTQALALGAASPPFSKFICQKGDVKVLVHIQHFRQTHGAGPVLVIANGAAWSGGWNLKAADEGTRLTGYYHLYVTANLPSGGGSLHLRTLVTPSGGISSGWLTTPTTSTGVNCKILI